MRALMVLALFPAAAWADEAQPKGMPQLDFANPLTVSQIVWMMVIFAVLYLLLSGWALPKVGRVLDDRATRIANDLDTARAAKAQADAAGTEAREASRRAHVEAQTEINAAVEAAKRDAAAKAAIATAELDARLAEAEQRIAAARRSAMASLPEIAAAAATAMIERLSGKSANPAAIHAAVAPLLPTA